MDNFHVFGSEAIPEALVARIPRQNWIQLGKGAFQTNPLQRLSRAGLAQPVQSFPSSAFELCGGDE